MRDHLYKMLLLRILVLLIMAYNFDKIMNNFIILMDHGQYRML